MGRLNADWNYFLLRGVLIRFAMQGSWALNVCFDLMRTVMRVREL